MAHMPRTGAGNRHGSGGGSSEAPLPLYLSFLLTPRLRVTHSIPFQTQSPYSPVLLQVREHVYARYLILGGISELEWNPRRNKGQAVHVIYASLPNLDATDASVAMSPSLVRRSWCHIHIAIFSRNVLSMTCAYSCRISYTVQLLSA